VSERNSESEFNFILLIGLNPEPAFYKCCPRFPQKPPE